MLDKHKKIIYLDLDIHSSNITITQCAGSRLFVDTKVNIHSKNDAIIRYLLTQKRYSLVFENNTLTHKKELHLVKGEVITDDFKVNIKVPEGFIVKNLNETK